MAQLPVRVFMLSMGYSSGRRSCTFQLFLRIKILNKELPTKHFIFNFSDRFINKLRFLKCVKFYLTKLWAGEIKRNIKIFCICRKQGELFFAPVELNTMLVACSPFSCFEYFLLFSLMCWTVADVLLQK